MSDSTTASAVAPCATAPDLYKCTPPPLTPQTYTHRHAKLRWSVFQMKVFATACIAAGVRDQLQQFIDAANGDFHKAMAALEHVSGGQILLQNKVGRFFYGPGWWQKRAAEVALQKHLKIAQCPTCTRMIRVSVAPGDRSATGYCDHCERDLTIDLLIGGAA